MDIPWPVFSKFCKSFVDISPEFVAIREESIQRMVAPTFRAMSRSIRNVNVIEGKLLSIIGSIYQTSSMA